MSQKDDIIAALAAGPMTMQQLAGSTGIKLGTLQAQLSELKKKGRAVCEGIGSRDPWRLPVGAVAKPAPQPVPKPEPIRQPDAAPPTVAPRQNATETVLARLAEGATSTPELTDLACIGDSAMQKIISRLVADGMIEHVSGRGVNRDPKVWALTTPVRRPAPADDPSMIPGGPDPACETAALDELDPPGRVVGLLADACDELDEDEPEDEAPTADVIALAIVAAARITGEDPLRIAVPDAFVRARFPAVKALSVFYPDQTRQALGRCVGLTKLSPKVAENIPAFPWWNEVGDPAFEAAISALEAA